jgi:transposase, IS30 family
LVGQRQGLSFSDRVEIATGLKARLGIRQIARSIGRDPSVVSREVRRNRGALGEYKPVTADCRAERRRSRPKPRKVAIDEVLQARVGRSFAFR